MNPRHKYVERKAASDKGDPYAARIFYGIKYDEMIELRNKRSRERRKEVE